MSDHFLPVLSPATTAAGVEAGLGAAERAYLTRVRAAAARLARRELDPADTRGALEALEAVSTVDADVPTLSRRPAVRYVKQGVKQAGGWYLRYLAQQVTALGTATVALGSAMAIRADALEEATGALARRVAALEARLDAVEGAAGGNGDAAGGTGDAAGGTGGRR